MTAKPQQNEAAIELRGALRDLWPEPEYTSQTKDEGTERKTDRIFILPARLKTEQRKDVHEAHAKYQAPECLLS